MILPLTLALGAGAASVLAQYDAASEIREQYGEGMSQQLEKAIAADQAAGDVMPDNNVVGLFGSDDDTYQPYKVDCPTGTTFLRSAQSVSDGCQAELCLHRTDD